MNVWLYLVIVILLPPDRYACVLNAFLSCSYFYVHCSMLMNINLTTPLSIIW